MKLARSLIIGAALSVVAAAAHAQGNPSTDQIINSLRPSGGIMGGTRGIRPVGPSAPPHASEAAPASAGASAPVHPAAPRATASAPAARESGGAPPSVNLTVQFANGSAELTPAAVRTLTSLGQALSSNTLGSYRFRIEGHTDTLGPDDANKALSERRAQAVVTFLVSRFHIDASRLDAVGMGEEGLLVQTPDNTSEPRNRRVQVINLGS
ncbi:MAG: OmpA family protein [Acetobacteraceae bacterium]|nr:OmpA family protein [Acetobacteraceae bacterium]